MLVIVLVLAPDPICLEPPSCPQAAQLSCPSMLRPNPGAPTPPSVQEAAEQLERLWPLERAVADSLGYPGEEHRTPWEDTEVGLLCTMLREGCTGWKAEASCMYEATRLRFLTSKDGGVVFWLWVLGENMSGSDIVGYLREYLPVYYPFVHKTEQSVRVALAACARIQDTNLRRAEETLQLSLRGIGAGEGPAQQNEKAEAPTTKATVEELDETD